MIRAFYGLTQNPFDLRELQLLPQQQEIHDTLKVHCQQGGLCLVLGVPEQLLVDNGSIYCSQEITLICARVGCLLRHTAVRDAAAKGKIERFFRRVRDQFLVQKLDLASLETLNRQFTHWVENDYNATAHDALGMKPIDRFGIDLARVRFLAPSEHTDELFYAEATRKVEKDNTFSFHGRR